MPSNYTPTTWGQSTERDHRVPSGQLCRIKDLGLEEMAEAGVIDQMDTLGYLVQTEHIDRVGGKKPQDRKTKKPTKAQKAAQEQEGMVEWLRDKTKMAAIGKMLDKVASVCVIEPPVANPYTPVDEKDPSKGERKLEPHERAPGMIYADKLKFADKMSIFQEVFQGMEDLESFREGPSEDVAALPDVEESPEVSK
jgi:hypothetical protein